MPVRRKRRPAVARTSSWDELAGRRCGGWRPHGDAGDDEEETECVARRAGRSGEENEAGGCPDAAEEAHGGGGDAVAGEEREDRGGELERNREREHTESDLVAFGGCDPAELESGDDECCGGEAEEPDRERACDRAEHDARAPGELFLRGGLCGGAAHPTASACGAPVLMRVRNHFACVSASVWQLLATSFSSLSRTALAAWSAIVHVTATACAIR